MIHDRLTEQVGWLKKIINVLHKQQQKKAKTFMNRCPFGLQRPVFVLEQKVKSPKAGSYLVFTKNLLLGVNCSHKCRNVIILARVPTLSYLNEFVAIGMFIILTHRHEEPLFFSCVSLFLCCLCFHFS